VVVVTLRRAEKHQGVFVMGGRIAVVCGLLVGMVTTGGAEPALDQDQQLRFFESRIRPLLIDRCHDCHAGQRREGGLRLDVADMIVRGGDNGPVIVPGDPEQSRLIAAIRYADLEMPPDEPLSVSEQADLEQWIRQGAVWPVMQSRDDETADLSWWAAEPLDPLRMDRATTAGLADAASPIDDYIDHQLQQHGLHRAPPASSEKLIRRLSYDLTGLPPTPAAIDEFVADDSPTAYADLVERLLADPAYGERMARLWLDLVRYAESDGWRADSYRQTAWRYRQFVTDAFNSKLPYDRFVALQLAGDEIAPTEEAAMSAVGFLRLGIYEYNQRDAEGQWQTIVDELTDVTADVFLATGLACAKCHDHKFDPISRADYFQFRSVFEPLLFVDLKTINPPDLATQTQIDDLLKELNEIEGDAINQIRDFTIGRFSLTAQAMYYKPPSQRTSYEHQIAYLMERQVIDEGLKGNALETKIGKDQSARREQIRKRLRQLGADPYAPANWLTVMDAAAPIRPTMLPGRTIEKNQQPAFEPAIPRVFGGQRLQTQPPTAVPTSSGRRTALAAWITSPTNPITARVVVNRLWQYHFGTGLVSSANDFGRLGSPPSHPGLLDYLAQRLIDSDWDIQRVQREIVMSAAYRQSALHPQAREASRVDPTNRLIWKRAVRRLDAEQFRDSLLVAMDRLIDHVGGESIAGTAGRRSLYLRRYRNQADEMLATWDAPPGIVGTARRDQTTTAPQALMMMNNRRMIAAATGFAARVRQEVAGDGADFVRHAHRILASTDPDPQTVELLAPLAAAGAAGQVDVCHVLLNSNAFLYVE
jgi:hypothetical protein